MEYLFLILALSIAGLAWLIYGLANNRMKDAEQELDEWSGVTDVRRKTRDKLNDPDYVKRVQDKFNP